MVKHNIKNPKNLKSLRSGVTRSWAEESNVKLPNLEEEKIFDNILKLYSDKRLRKEVDNLIISQGKEPSAIQKIVRFFTEPTWEQRKARSTISFIKAKETGLQPHVFETRTPLDRLRPIESFTRGMEQSVTGLIYYQDKEVLEENELFSMNLNIIERALYQAGMLFGDLPFMATGAVIGAAGGPLTAFGGAFGLPAGLRSVYVNKIRNGEIKNAREFFNNLSDASMETLKGIATGVATGAAGRAVLPKAGDTAKALAEIITMASVSSVLEGRLPTVQDFTDTAILIGGLHGITKITGGTFKTKQEILEENIYRIYEKTGVPPRDMLHLALIDHDLAVELQTRTKGIPKMFEEVRAKKDYELLREDYNNKYSELKEKTEKTSKTKFPKTEEVKLPKEEGYSYKYISKDTIEEIKIKGTENVNKFSSIDKAALEIEKGLDEITPIEDKIIIRYKEPKEATNVRKRFDIDKEVYEMTIEGKREVVKLTPEGDLKKVEGVEPKGKVINIIKSDDIKSYTDEGWRPINDIDVSIIPRHEKVIIDQLKKDRLSIPNKILNEYKEKDWAQEEIQRRKDIPENVLEDFLEKEDLKKAKEKDIPPVEETKIVEEGEKLTEKEIKKAPKILILKENGVEVEQKLTRKDQKRLLACEKIGAASLEKVTTKKSKATFPSEEMQRNWEANREIPTVSLAEKVSAKLKHYKEIWSREYEKLPRGEKYAQIRFDLLRLNKQRSIVINRVLKQLKDLTKDLKKDYELFEKKIVMDDMQHTYIEGGTDQVRLWFDPGRIPIFETKEGFGIAYNKINKLVEANPLVKERVRKRAELFDAIRQEYTNSYSAIGLDVSHKFGRPEYFHHRVLEHLNINYFNKIRGIGKKVKAPKRGFQYKRGISEKDYSTNFFFSESEVLSEMLYDIEVAKLLKTIKNKYDITGKLREKIVKERDEGIEGEPKREEILKEIPEDYAEWSLGVGQFFRLTDRQPAIDAGVLVEKHIKAIVGKEGIEALNKAYVNENIGKKIIIPKELSTALDNIVETNIVKTGLSEHALNFWKRYQLTNPYRLIKYNLRNLTGDLEASIVGNPQTVLRAPRAFWITWFKRSGKDYNEWVDRGGKQLTLQQQELRQADKLYHHLKISKLRKTNPIKWAKKTWDFYWKGAQGLTDLRESILRFAAYGQFKKEILKDFQKGGEGKPKSFAMSVKKEIMGLKSLDKNGKLDISKTAADRAFWLSNDMLGAYDRVSAAGKYIKQKWIPFWSFQELNFRRYKQAFKNAAMDNRLTYTIGKKIVGKTIVVGPRVVIGVGKLYLKLKVLESIMTLFNNSWTDDEGNKLEDGLPEYARVRPHIIWGVDDETGETQYMGNLLAFKTDLLELVGLDDISYISEWFTGNKSATEIAVQFKEDVVESTKHISKPLLKLVKSASDKAIGGLTPYIKIPVESILGISTFPSVWDNRKIQNRLESFWKNWSLQNEYRLLTGKPRKEYFNNLFDMFYNRSDYKKAAYSDIITLKHKFLKSKDKGTVVFVGGKKHSIIYNMYNALRLDDIESYIKYSKEYDEFITEHRLEKVVPKIEYLKNKAPLTGIPKKYINEFIDSLNLLDKERLEIAKEYYKELIDTYYKAERLYLNTRNSPEETVKNIRIEDKTSSLVFNEKINLASVSSNTATQALKSLEEGLTVKEVEDVFGNIPHNIASTFPLIPKSKEHYLDYIDKNIVGDERSFEALRQLEQGYPVEEVEYEWGSGEAGATFPGYYDPVDLGIDVLLGLYTAGTYPAIKLLGKAVKEGSKKAAARIVGKSVGYGAAAGAAMQVTDSIWGNTVVNSISGIVGPTATQALLTGNRVAVAKALADFGKKRPDLGHKITKILKERFEDLKKVDKIFKKYYKQSIFEEGDFHIPYVRTVKIGDSLEVLSKKIPEDLHRLLDKVKLLQVESTVIGYKEYKPVTKALISKYKKEADILFKAMDKYIMPMKMVAGGPYLTSHVGMTEAMKLYQQLPKNLRAALENIERISFTKQEMEKAVLGAELAKYIRDIEKVTLKLASIGEDIGKAKVKVTLTVKKELSRIELIVKKLEANEIELDKKLKKTVKINDNL